MPPRIDSPSIPDSYFPIENNAPGATAAAPPAHSAARPSSTAHAVRSGSRNLERFLNSLNCFSSGPVNMDVTTSDGRENYKLAVRAWAARRPDYVRESHERKAIAERIERWLEADDPAATLDLSNSALSSLPPLPSNLQSLDISNAFDSYGPRKFPKSWPAGLRELNISSNKLKKLPDNLPDTLTTLSAWNCSLTSLPSKLPQSLEKLHVAGNWLRALPGKLPPGLLVLDARFNKLEEVPALPDTLTGLNLSNNPLHTLPRRLPAGLLHLHLDSVRLFALPPLPAGLVGLSVRNNALQQFNEPLPAGLKNLDVHNNPLMALPPLPDTLERLDISQTLVLELPASLPANLAYLNISHSDVQELTDDLRQAVGRPERPLTFVAEGTRHSVQPGQQAAVGTLNRYGVGMTSASLSKAVEAWYGAPNAKRSEAWERIYTESQDGIANATVPLWTLLDSLEGTAECPPKTGDTDETREAREEMRQAFKQRVSTLLDAVLADKDLRKTCLTIVHDRVESCHDNIALGFDEMEQAHLAARAMKGEFSQEELVKLGIGRLKLLLLDELAIPKGGAAALEVAAEYGDRPTLETVEVVLAYRLSLAERLDLPIKTKQMLYSDTARVTEQDLAQAEQKVNEAVADDERVAAFMADWRPWQMELERRHPTEFSREALSDAEDKLMDEVMELQVSYDKFCKEKGEFSEDALNTKEKMNLLKPKFETLEEDMFRAARERLTRAYMGLA